LDLRLRRSSTMERRHVRLQRRKWDAIRLLLVLLLLV
jgi:hypothetical protein